MNELQVVVFSLNNEECGVDTSQVQEIVKYRSVTEVPEMPDFIDGIIDLRGKVIPIVNLNRRFGMGNTEITRKTKIIITKLGEILVGFIVNDVSGIIKLTPENLETPPDILHKAGNTYLTGVGKKDGRLISVLDLESVLTENEAQKLTAAV